MIDKGQVETERVYEKEVYALSWLKGDRGSLQPGVPDRYV
jgi:hypothetical protein